MLSANMLLDDSDEAPDNFQISTSNGGSHWSDISRKCPLCVYSRKSFYCRDCVRSGNFIHSSDRVTETYAEKQQKYRNIKNAHRTLESRCEQLLQKKKLVEDLRYNIKRKRENITTLHKLLIERAANISESARENEDLSKRLEAIKKMFPQYENNVFHISQFVNRNVSRNEKLAQQLTVLYDQIKFCVRYDMDAFLTYIFPMSQIITKSEHASDLSPEAPDTINALADASRTAYIRGRWIFQDSQNECQHVIVAPSLPGNGDYSAYNDWVATNKDGVPSTSTGTNETLSSNNQAYRISAALTYTAQFVNLLSFYLDVRLTNKLAYGDFCKKELSEQSFNRKVARLNRNILHICHGQMVPLNSLSRMHTLENLKILLKSDLSDLGRIGPVDILHNQMVAYDILFTNDLADEDSEAEDDENSFPNEWEAVPHLSPSDTVTAPQLQAMQQQSVSIAGGLMNNAVASVTSIWRGFTGR